MNVQKTKEWRKPEILGERAHNQVSVRYGLLDGGLSEGATLPILILRVCVPMQYGFQITSTPPP